VKEIAELNAKLGPLEAEVKLVREERDKGKHELGLVKSEKFGLECKLRESEPKIAVRFSPSCLDNLRSLTQLESPLTLSLLFIYSLSS
jgi:hypothetical protein